MLEIQERTIDGIDFRYNPMMAKPARRMLVGLIRRFGGSMASGLETLGKEDLSNVDEKMDMLVVLGRLTGSIAGVIREITFNLDEDYYEKLTDTLGARSEMRVTSEDGQAAWMTMNNDLRNLEFGNRLLLEAKWVAFCLEAQYEDFFGLLSTASQQAIAVKVLGQAKTQSRSDSQRGSTGPSSESPQAQAMPVD